jgi:hypothetical protein
VALEVDAGLEAFVLLALASAGASEHHRPEGFWWASLQNIPVVRFKPLEGSNSTGALPLIPLRF